MNKQRTSRWRQDAFDVLPEDLVVFILCKLSSSASRPSQFISMLLTCKKMNRLGLHPLVLSKVGAKALVGKPTRWSEYAHRFLKQCVAAGNVEACYILGMIRFYCLENRASGASLMAKAAIKSHAPALYSLAVIQFNGSGGSKDSKDLQAGVSLCARAAHLGHISALREIGHCLQDGYGVRQDVALGRRLLVQANARELASVLGTVTQTTSPESRDQRCLMTCLYRNHHQQLHCPMTGAGCSLLSDFGCNVPAQETHPANMFMAMWVDLSCGDMDFAGLRLCSHFGCGRVETRPNEFRRCSVCGMVNYCSRGCQALDWKFAHKEECSPVDRWVEGDDGDDDDDGNGDGEMVDGGEEEE